MARPQKAAPGLTPGAKVYYPAHGVGELVSTEEDCFADSTLEVHVISFPRARMTLRVPLNKAKGNGLISLETFASDAAVKKALTTIAKDRKVSRMMWSRRASELEAKINHGDLNSLAEVIRDMNRSQEDTHERSYSENELLRKAGERFVDILCGVWEKDQVEVEEFLNEHLKKNGKNELLFGIW